MRREQSLFETTCHSSRSFVGSSNSKKGASSVLTSDALAVLGWLRLVVVQISTDSRPVCWVGWLGRSKPTEGAG
jgi:hypothetical protein